MASFVPKVEILSESQRRLWPELRATPKGFVLYGGTAIALRLSHRESLDFDFFSSEPFVPRELLAGIPYLSDAEVIQEAPDTLSCRVKRGDPIKLSFLGGLTLNRVRGPDLAQGSDIFVASLLDLTATKLRVVVERANAKDYLDIDALIGAGIELHEGLGAARAVFGERYNPLTTMKALTYFEDGDVASLPEPCKARLVAAARAVDFARIPKLKAFQGVTPDG